ncbi:MAG TPA: Rap1a/Tai family immunity protein [Croceibacterium sp.]
MHRKLWALGLVILAGAGAPPFATPAHAYFLDGDELMNHCSATIADERFDPAVCVTYIMGAYDGFMFQRLARNQPRCTPRTLTAGQLREVVIEYLQANPDNRAMDASALVWNAIIAKWPDCGTIVSR